MICALAEKHASGRSDKRWFCTATLIVVALIVAGFLTDAALGCGNVYDVDLWLGENQDAANAHNTNTVYNRHTDQSFYWHVHWAAYGPDVGSFYGQVWDQPSIQLLQPLQWSATSTSRAKSGAAWWNPHVSSGWKIIMVKVKRTGGSWCWSNAVFMGITEVELEKLSAGNSPDLDPGVICLNAQSQYKKAKWKAKKVIPSGTTARVQNWGQMVTFSGIDGSDPSDLSEGETFWAEAVAPTEPGTYHINLIHNEEIDSLDTDSGTTFEFQMTATKYDATGGTTGSGSFDKNAGTVSAPKTTNPAGQTNGADVFWLYHAGVTTVPSGAYSGKVSAVGNAILDTDGTITIWANDYDGTMDAFAVTATLGTFISVTCNTSSGTDRYYTCVAGWRAEIEWDGQLPGQSATDDLDYANVPPPITGSTTRTWTTTPDVHLERLDTTRTYTVDTTEVGFYVRVGVASNAENPEFGLGGCYSTVPANNNSLASVEIEEEDDTFDIVP